MNTHGEVVRQMYSQISNLNESLEQCRHARDAFLAKVDEIEHEIAKTTDLVAQLRAAVEVLESA